MFFAVAIFAIWEHQVAPLPVVKGYSLTEIMFESTEICQYGGREAILRFAPLQLCFAKIATALPSIKIYLLTEILFIQIPLAIQFKIYNLLLYTIKPVGAKSPTGLYIKI